MTPPLPLDDAAPIQMRDTPERYGRVTRTLHWTIALLVAFQIVGMGGRLVYPRVEGGPSSPGWVSFMVGQHQAVGAILFVLIVARVLWALSNLGNRPAHGRHFIGRAASLGHAALYLLLLIIPSVALLRAYGSPRSWGPFGFEIFPPQQPPVQWMVDLGGDWHGELSWVLAVLIVGHVVMVGVHEAMWRDGTLARMLGRRPTRARQG